MKRIIGLILFVLILCGCAPVQKQQLNDMQWRWLDIYYVSNSNNGKVIESEPRQIPAEGLLSMVRNAIVEMKKNPVRKELSTPLPSNVEVRSVRLDNSILVIDFSKEYDVLQGISKTVANTCIVNTLVNFWSIESVTILVEGKLTTSQLKVRDIVLDEPKIMTGEQVIMLYFPNENGDMLNPEEHKVFLRAEDLAEKVALQALIDGPQYVDRSAIIPNGVILRSIYTDGGVCYVNFSKQFVENHKKILSSERMILKSIVWTLTSIDYIDKVQILVEGQKQRAFTYFDLSTPFLRDNLTE